MGDESRWNDQHDPDWGDRYRRPDRPDNEERFDRDERRYGAGDFEGSRQDRYGEPPYPPERGWPRYEPGQDSAEYHDRGGEEHGWERAASTQGYGSGRQEGRRREGPSRNFSGWDAPFGGHPLHREDQGRREERGGDAWDRLRSEGRSFLDRTREELATMFGAGRREDDYRYRREGEHRGKGPKGYRRSDDRIRDEVHERLTDDSWLDASNVEVTVQNGEVTLDGKVRTRADKRRAEDIVERVAGVGHVQNNLRAESDRHLGRDQQDTPPLI